jgi:bifunctional DNase/RNase
LLLGCTLQSGAPDLTARLVNVDSVKFDPTNESFVLLLNERGGQERELLILIGPSEAYAIARGIEDIDPPRPFTHDLIKNLVTGMKGRIERVVVTELKDNTFYAIIEIKIDGRKVKIDARPSDAIAVAVRTSSLIYVEEAVLRSAGDFPNSGSPREIDWRPAN